MKEGITQNGKAVRLRHIGCGGFFVDSCNFNPPADGVCPHLITCDLCDYTVDPNIRQGEPFIEIIPEGFTQ